MQVMLYVLMQFNVFPGRRQHSHSGPVSLLELVPRRRHRGLPPVLPLLHDGLSRHHRHALPRKLLLRTTDSKSAGADDADVGGPLLGHFLSSQISGHLVDDGSRFGSLSSSLRRRSGV